jgi:hypothetical protein
MNTSNLKRAAVFALAILLGGAGVLFLGFDHSRKVAHQQVSANSPPPIPAAQPADAANNHPVYAHSIVKGGIHSVAELLEVLRTNPEVAAHYRNFDVSKAQIVTLNHPLIGFVSYRIEGKGIFWTIHPISIPANEPLLFDGNLYIRLRCGNVISTRPMARVNKAEEPTDLDTVVDLIPPFHESGPSDESSEFFPGATQQSGTAPGSPSASGGSGSTPPVHIQVSTIPPVTGGVGGCIGCNRIVPIVPTTVIPLNPSLPIPPAGPPSAAVPEPDSLVLLMIGIGALPLLKIVKKRKTLASRLRN